VQLNTQAVCCPVQESESEEIPKKRRKIAKEADDKLLGVRPSPVETGSLNTQQLNAAPSLHRSLCGCQPGVRRNLHPSYKTRNSCMHSQAGQRPSVCFFTLNDHDAPKSETRSVDAGSYPLPVRLMNLKAEENNLVFYCKITLAHMSRPNNTCQPPARKS
jgi:hypothetical protein